MLDKTSKNVRVCLFRLNVQKHMGLPGPRAKETSLQSTQKKEDLRMTKVNFIHQDIT